VLRVHARARPVCLSAYAVHPVAVVSAAPTPHARAPAPACRAGSSQRLMAAEGAHVV